MLRATAHRGPDGAGLATASGTNWAMTLLEAIAPPLPGSWGMGHARLAITGLAGAQPLRDCQRQVLVGINGEIWNHGALRVELKGGHTLVQDSDCEVVPHVVERRRANGGASPLTLSDAVAGAVAELDGEYALAAMDGIECVLVRDPLGVKPLYFAHLDGQTAFASERKALWDLGLAAETLPPGSILTLGPRGQHVRRLTRAARPVAALADRGAARRAYAEALDSAIRKRVRGVPRVGVVFSGGVDSALVAQAALRAGATVSCFVVGTEGSADVEAARSAAAHMNFDLVVIKLEVDAVERVVPELLRAVEERNQLHVETALPLFFVAREAARQGIRVLLTGQGADELFAGYGWYPQILRSLGPEELRRRLREDRDLLFRECLEREDKASMWNGVELRVPFLDPEVVSVADAMPVEHMIRPEDGVGKWIHRELAQAWGVPGAIAWRPKMAAQHGSGSREVLRAVAGRHGAPPPAYSPVRSITEPVGSSQRYGHRFLREEQMWVLDREIQWWLDGLAAELGCVSPEETSGLKAYLEETMAPAVPSV